MVDAMRLSIFARKWAHDDAIVAGVRTRKRFFGVCGGWAAEGIRIEDEYYSRYSSRNLLRCGLITELDEFWVLQDVLPIF